MFNQRLLDKNIIIQYEWETSGVQLPIMLNRRYLELVGAQYVVWDTNTFPDIRLNRQH